MSVGEAMERRFTPVSIDANLGQAVEALLATAQHEFPVVDAFAKPVGPLTREDILNAVREHGRFTQILLVQNPSAPSKSLG